MEKNLKKSLESFDSKNFEDYQEFDGLIQDLKIFDLYIIYLMVRHELYKRGYNL